MPDQADLDALADSIVDGAQKPQSATVDGNSVSQVSVADKILAANHTAAKLATARAHFGLRFTKLIPPAAG